MFGLFSRSNLSFQERVLLVSTLVEAIIVADLADGGWLGVIHRAAIIDQWLKHMNKKAGALLRIGLSGAGKELAQALLSRMGSITH
jgi:tRNA G37 N-methylase TrmD